jgi:hypothetical protein
MSISGEVVLALLIAPSELAFIAPSSCPALSSPPHMHACMHACSPDPTAAQARLGEGDCLLFNVQLRGLHPPGSQAAREQDDPRAAGERDQRGCWRECHEAEGRARRRVAGNHAGKGKDKGW